jgi:retron-type reverse transcriptase
MSGTRQNIQYTLALVPESRGGPFFLQAGVMEDGLVSPVEEGTPQGGPLSPLLSNLVLDDLDKELTRRCHRFCRYADDCVPRTH